jgi:glucose/arabinose dehydrogenase/mono/diheme cytochrome c family protein
MIEWKDRNPRNSTFEGTARELLRLQHASPIHPLGDMTFNPVARPGDPDWRVMYVGVGDGGAGEQRDIRRLTPQRLDTLAGKILRIIPDLSSHKATSTVSENGRYRIPNDNPFAKVEGARKEIWAYGLRNPHRLIWDVDPSRPTQPTLFAFNIGLVSWETVMIIHKGANYGYSLREGTQMMSLEGMSAIPQDDTIPMRISDTVVRGTVTPTYPVIQFPHTAGGGDAISNGFVYRGKAIPALKNKLVFGDVTTGRIWYAELADVLAADDGKAATVAPAYEIDANLRRIVEENYRVRGGKGQNLPGTARVSGRGRVDLRFASDNAGELYVLTKSDGMIRKVVGAAISEATSSVATSPAPSQSAIAAGKAAYDEHCAACHGNMAQGAVKAGFSISIIEEQRKKQPPDLTDNQWDHGSTDTDIYTVTKRGVPTTMMPPFDGDIPDTAIWNIVNYLRSITPKTAPRP